MKFEGELGWKSVSNLEERETSFSDFSINHREREMPTENSQREDHVTHNTTLESEPRRNFLGSTIKL